MLDCGINNAYVITRSVRSLFVRSYCPGCCKLTLAPPEKIESCTVSTPSLCEALMALAEIANDHFVAVSLPGTSRSMIASPDFLEQPRAGQ